MSPSIAGIHLEEDARLFFFFFFFLSFKEVFMNEEGEGEREREEEVVILHITALDLRVFFLYSDRAT